MPPGPATTYALKYFIKSDLTTPSAGRPYRKKHIRQREARRNSGQSASNGFPELDPEVILALERSTWRAQQGDPADMLDFLAPGCVVMFPLGLRVSDDTVPSIEDILTSPNFVPWTDYEMIQPVVTPIGGAGAVVSYRVHAQRPDVPMFKALITSVWKWDAEDERWKMCAHQQTPFDQDIEEVV